MGLTLHQLGRPFRIYERVAEPKPLGVGINLQPNAVRELFDLGLERELDAIGTHTRQYGFCSKFGLPIWVEARGLAAGYAWPQFSVHRGQFQMMLLRILRERAGDVVETGVTVARFETSDRGAALILTDGRRVTGDVVIAANGIHSAIRRQMVPDEGDPIWNGAIMWRGTSPGPHFLGGNAMFLAGHDSQRFVAYPLTPEDPATGLATINWIAEMRVNPARALAKGDWNRPADKDDFLPAFQGWNFGWVDCPGLIRASGTVYEYPMVDREPLASWTQPMRPIRWGRTAPPKPLSTPASSARPFATMARPAPPFWPMRPRCGPARRAYCGPIAARGPTPSCRWSRTSAAGISTIAT